MSIYLTGQLARDIAKQTGLAETDVRKMLDAFQTVIIDRLRMGGSVGIEDFCRFYPERDPNAPPPIKVKEYVMRFPKCEMYSCVTEQINQPIHPKEMESCIKKT